MTIDIRTLFIVLVLNCCLMGVVFVVNGMRAPDGEISVRAGAAALLMACGVILLIFRGTVPDGISVNLANALLLLGVGCGWTSIRQFVGGRAPSGPAVAGAVVWLAACAIPAFYAEMAYRIALVSILGAAYCVAGAWDLLRPRAERSFSGRPLGFLLAGHAVVVTIRAAHALFAGAPADMFNGGFVHSLFMAEPALLLFAVSLFGVRMGRDRAERELRHDADTDSLTGVLNRRAFFAGAERRVAGAVAVGRPAGLLLFDLDHFKLVNDRYGHLAGDAVLSGFARVIARAIRSSDLVGRIGGEEFAALLDGVDETTAGVIAERIRVDFATLPLEHEGAVVHATVSVGVAVRRGGDTDLKSLFAAADRALYEAKRGGRDRVRSALALAS